MTRTKVCAEPGCPTLTTSARCPAHTAAPWASSTRRARLPSDWRTIRARVLRRDGGTCQICGAPATEVDHIAAGDNHHPSNLQAICTPCHRRKSSAEGGSAGR